MIVKETPIEGAKLLELSKHVDSRGSFMRLWCTAALEEAGLANDFVQANVAETRAAGTIRGLHYQVEPFAEDKLIRCTRGAVFDVVVDLRPDSTSYLQWHGVELSAGDDRLLLAPRGCAHGYQTLLEDSALEYFVSSPYSPEHERGIRWNDPSFTISWPSSNPIVSNKDSAWPDYSEQGM